jgi:hypothetical protein
MNTFKNLLIAILTGLLALALFTQPAQSAPKTYDALKLAQYTACVNAHLNTDIALIQINGGNGDLNVNAAINVNCVRYRP